MSDIQLKTDEFNKLNDRQREAVNTLEGVVMVSAGAGSGKTRVLTCRVARLLQEGILGYNILAITFTNKAAREMRTRVNMMTGENNEVTICTFHSLCGRILRWEADYLPHHNKKFTIYDTSMQESIAKRVLKEMGWAQKPSDVLSWVSTIKEQGMTVDGFKNYIESYYGYGREIEELDQKKIAFYEAYQKELNDNNAMDFDDMLLNVVELFKEYPAVRGKYQSRFRYLLIDEYQDTNHIQYELIKLLFSGNLCVVGDADQSIYGWRGADERNITEFEKDFPNRKIILLEQNYRSTNEILSVANEVIANNPNRIKKNLWTDKSGGMPVSYTEYETGSQEADAIATYIENLASEGQSYNDMAILYRMNSQSRAFEEALIRHHIPYMVLGGVRFYERKEIKDVLAYLTIMINPYDSVSLTRALLYPSKGLGTKLFEEARKYADEHHIHVFEALSNPYELDIPDAKKEKLDNFFATLFDCSAEPDIPSMIERIVKDFGIREKIIEDESKKKDSQAEDRIQNIDEFIGYAKSYKDEFPDASLEDFLEQVALFSDADTENRVAGVSLMTVHAAKGLEFDTVFLPGLEDNIFPTFRSLEDYTGQSLEEERRLFYVAITRAKQRLFMSNAESRMLFGRLQYNMRSMFLPETAIL